MSRPSTLHNAAFTMAGQLLARLFALVFYAVLARKLGPDLYGDQGFGAAVGTLCVVLLEPGLNPLLVRDGARDREGMPRLVGETLGYKLGMLALVWPLAVLLTYLAGYRDTALLAVLLAGGTVLVGALEEMAANALVALERMDLEGTLRVVSKVVGMGPALVILLLGGGFVPTLGAVTVGAMVTGVVGMWFLQRAGVRVWPKMNPGPMVRRILEAWPLAVSGILWMLTLRLDQVMASAMGVGHDALGNYNAAVKVVEALVLFPSAVASAFQPVIARAFVRGKEECSTHLHAAVFVALSLVLPITTGGAMLATGLTGFVYGDRFDGTPELLAIQLLALPLIGLQFIASHTLLAAGAIRGQAVAVAINLVVNVVTNLVLVPRLGVEGASWAAVVGGAAGCGTMLVLLRQQGLRVGLLSALWRSAVAAAVMAAALRGVGDLPLAVSIAAGASAYGAVFFLVGGGRALRALKDVRRRD